jgi:CubicO group peptidase (beta-lactamase class C family)
LLELEGVSQVKQAFTAADAALLAYPEYDLNVPVASWWMHNASADIVQAKINEGYRLHDIDYLSASPERFTATFVQNTGSYARTGSGWSRNLTKTEVEAIAADSTRRIVDLGKTGTGPSARWAVVWVSNAGTQARNYKLVLDEDAASFQGETAGYRVTSLVAGTDGLLSGVFLQNTGIDTRSQWFSIGSGVELTTDQTDNFANCAANLEPCKRLAEIAPLGNDSFFAVFEEAFTEPSTNNPNVRVLREGEQTWWGGALDYHAGNVDRPDSIEHVIARLAARPIKLKVYNDAGGTQHYLAILASNGSLPRGGDRADDNAATAALDAVIQRQAKQAGLPGLLVGIMRDGKLVHAKGYGFGDIQAGRVLQPTDMARIASVSKTITNSAIFRMIQDGVRTSDAGPPITLQTTPWGTFFEYSVPPAPANAAPNYPHLGQVTIEQLIRHTSGLRFDNQGDCAALGATEFEPDYCNPFQWLLTQEEYVAMEKKVNAAPAIVGGAFYYRDASIELNPAIPGVQPLYKNAEHHMLGHVIEALTGMQFEDYVALKLTNPLNLDRIRIGRMPDDPDPPGLFQARNYQPPKFYNNDRSWDDRGQWVLNSPHRYPASSFAASPIDLLRWQASLEGTAPGYRGIDATQRAAMGASDHGGYLPGATIAQLVEYPVGATKYVYFWVSTSDLMNRGMFNLDAEIQKFITDKGNTLPARDLFAVYLSPPCLQYFHNLPIADFQGCFDYQTALGLQPKTLTVSQDGLRISGGFEPGATRRTHHLLAGATYEAVNQQELAVGSVPLFTNVINVGQGPRFTAVWERTPVAAQTWWNMTASDYSTRWFDLSGQGYLQTDFFPYQDGGLKFVGTWKLQPNSGYSSYHSITPAAWTQFNLDRLAEKKKITHFVAYQDAGQQYYGAIWENIAGNYQLTISNSGAEYQTQFDARGAGAWRLHRLHSFGTDSFAAIWYRPEVTMLANGDMLFSVTFPKKQQYVEAFVQQNGIQNVAGNIVSSEVNNGDGTYTYQRVKAASSYRAGDLIRARFYSYAANSPGVFTPGPTSATWTPNYVYGQGTTCVPVPPATNIQLTAASATASSIEGSNWVASKAIDGNMSTRWSSQFSNPQWITLDLGTVQYVHHAKLYWETAASANYDVRVSNDGQNWTTIYSDTHGNGGTDEFVLDQTTRYVRVYSHQRTTQYGVSLWEFQLFGDPNPTCQ